MREKAEKEIAIQREELELKRKEIEIRTKELEENRERDKKDGIMMNQQQQMLLIQQQVMQQNATIIAILGHLYTIFVSAFSKL